MNPIGFNNNNYSGYNNKYPTQIKNGNVQLKEKENSNNNIFQINRNNNTKNNIFPINVDNASNVAGYNQKR